MKRRWNPAGDEAIELRMGGQRAHEEVALLGNRIAPHSLSRHFARLHPAPQPNQNPQ